MSGNPEDPRGDPDLQESTPGSSGPEGAQGGMGVSSERTGPTGPGQHSSDGVRDTAPGAADGADVPPEQRPGQVEENPVGLEPKAGYSTKDPRSD